MNRADLVKHLLGKPGTVEDYPFGPDTPVFKVGGKLFALISVETEANTINLKCDPDHAVILRQVYPDDVKPGYHMNKKHWNTVTFDGSVPDDELLDMLQESYDLVVAKLPKAEREALKRLSASDDEPA